MHFNTPEQEILILSPFFRSLVSFGCNSGVAGARKKCEFSLIGISALLETGSFHFVRKNLSFRGVVKKQLNLNRQLNLFKDSESK